MYCIYWLHSQSYRSSAIGDLAYDHPKSWANFPPDGDLPRESLDSLQTSDVSDGLFEFGQCILRGYLYKKERFMTWVKLFCIIRNNFLECHKSQGDSYSPVLKLFLPGSEVKEGGSDPKKKWAFQVSFDMVLV